MIGIISVAFFFTCSISATAGSEGPAKTETVDRIVAIVNDDIITLFELNRLLKPYEEGIKNGGYGLEKEHEMLFRIRNRLLNGLIDKVLTDQQAKRYDLAISEEEIDKNIERMKVEQFQTDETLRAELKKQGLTMKEYRDLMREQILRGKLVNYEVKSKIVITNEDVQAYYQAHIEQYRGSITYHLRNIILRTSAQDSPSEKEAVKLKMEMILSQIKDGKSFETLARTYSESAAAADGGDLGFFEINELSRQIKEAVKDLKTGELSSVVETPQGYQLFFAEERVEKPGKSLAEASPEIREKLYNEIVNKAFRSWLDGLRDQSVVKIIN